MNLLISLSGGRSSAFMLHHILSSLKYQNDNKVIVFANTSRERLETINFLKDIQNHWKVKIYCIEGVYPLELGKGIDFKIVDIDKLKMDGSVFYELIKKKNIGTYSGVCHQDAPFCAGGLKTEPINKFAKFYFNGQPYKSAIGMRLEDTPKRITVKEAFMDTDKIYPLLTDFEKPISQKEIYKFFKHQSFDLAINSKFGNCDFCWKADHKNIIARIQTFGTGDNWWFNMEKEFGNNFYRDNYSFEYLKKLAHSGTQQSLIDIPSFDCYC